VKTFTIPDSFNVASYFLDRHLQEGRERRVAIECGDERVTYGKLAREVNRVGWALREEFDVRMEERVLLLLQDTPAFAYSFFGAIRIGAVAVPVNTLLKPGDYRYLLNDCRARVAIVSPGLLAAITAIPRHELSYLQHVIVTGDAPAGTRSLEEITTRAPEGLWPAPTSKDDSAFWLYSSGSTGAPKGCIHSHHDMVVCSELYAKGILKISEADRFFSVAKLFFAYGLGNALYFPLAVGGTSILWPGTPSAENVFGVIERHRPTLFFSVPTNYAMLLAYEQDRGEDFDLSNLRHAVSAGEALPPTIFARFRERFGVEILDAIGSTEALHMFISNSPGAVRPGSSGRIIPGYEARLVDDNDRSVAAGAIGNLLIKGDSVCTGYWNQHEKTKDTFEGHWLRTGDKYYQDSDGYFWFAGRSDDMLKVGGIWVSPVEIENALVEHPAVLEAAVIGRADKDELVKPMAYVVLSSEAPAGQDLERELQAFVAGKLAEYKRPRWVEFLSELPKTATGKTQRFRLRQCHAESAQSKSR